MARNSTRRIMAAVAAALALPTCRSPLVPETPTLAEAGFPSIDVHLIEHDPFNAYFVVRP